MEQIKFFFRSPTTFMIRWTICLMIGLVLPVIIFGGDLVSTGNAKAIHLLVMPLLYVGLSYLLCGKQLLSQKLAGKPNSETGKQKRFFAAAFIVFLAIWYLAFAIGFYSVEGLW